MALMLSMQVYLTGPLQTPGALHGVGTLRYQCSIYLTLIAGEKGYFRIRRGQNDCGFEAGVLAGMPDI
jgi:hypothetical protein